MSQFNVNEDTFFKSDVKGIVAAFIFIFAIGAWVAVVNLRVSTVEASQLETTKDRYIQREEYNKTLIEINERLARIETKLDRK